MSSRIVRSDREVGMSSELFGLVPELDGWIGMWGCRRGCSGWGTAFRGRLKFSGRDADTNHPPGPRPAPAPTMSQEESPEEPAESQGPADAAPSQGADLGFVSDAARKVLSMSMGVHRVSLEDMGPALFNRQGSATSGQH